MRVSKKDTEKEKKIRKNRVQLGRELKKMGNKVSGGGDMDLQDEEG